MKEDDLGEACGTEGWEGALARKSEGKRPFGKPRRRQNDGMQNVLKEWD
jgi:hypothetical protein